MLTTKNGFSPDARPLPRRRAPRFAAACPLLLTAGGLAAPPAGPPVALWLEGDAAAGTGAAFQTFDRPNLTAQGMVCFTADTDGPTAEDDVLYVGGTLIAREGSPVAGLSGATLGTFEFFETAHQANVHGEVAYVTSLGGVPEGTTRAVMLGASVVARQGDPAPGIGGRSLADFGFVGLADDGRVGMLVDLDGAASDDSVIMFAGGPLYREDGIVPGLGGHRWDGNFDEVQWNGRGDVLFEGNTSMPSAADTVLFLRRAAEDGTVVEMVVAQEGQLVDAATGPDSLATIAQTALAEDGGWALRGTLAAAASDADGIVMTSDGVMAQEGSAVAELPGVTLGPITSVSIDSAGIVAFAADLRGDMPPGVDEAIFVDGCLVAKTGDPAPGLPAGTVFTDIGFEDVFVNDGGQLVFAASYGGTESGDGLFSIALTAPCPADLDASGAVGGDDLWSLLAAWGPCSGCPADLDESGGIDFRDLLALLTAWGPCG